MGRLELMALTAQRAIEQAATTALVISLRGAIIVTLSALLVAMRMWRRF